MKKTSVPTNVMYTMEHTDNLNYRYDGRVEWVCEHGVGHTIEIPEWVKKKGTKQQKIVWFSHGCCGCCSSDECKKIREDLN